MAKIFEIILTSTFGKKDYEVDMPFHMKLYLSFHVARIRPSRECEL